MLYIPRGYTFSSVEANFRYQDREDLALIFSHSEASCAAVFTKNRFQAAPILVAKENLLKTKWKNQAIMINSGIANACTGEEGIKVCLESVRLLSRHLNIKEEMILPASTGVIGEQFDDKKWPPAISKLGEYLGKKDLVDVAQAILTTDTFPKIAFRRFEHEGHIATITGIAKGAGMICPNMATMLGFIISDLKISPEPWQGILTYAVNHSFNRISVDGDTSTNDCVIAMANGKSSVGVTPDILSQVRELVTEVCLELAYQIVQDAEGGTKVIHLEVKGAEREEDAEILARAIAHSPLVKTALYGEDANWGRIVAAMGKTQARFIPEKVKVIIGDICIFEKGCGVKIDTDSLLVSKLKRQDITITIDLQMGEEGYWMLFADLTEEYVKINGCYRT